MTRISVEEYYDSCIISIEGHTGFAAPGEDIVCAGVSAVCYTLVNALRRAEAEGCLFIRDERISDGSVLIEIEPYSFAREKTDTIIDTCMAGFSALEEEFPDYIEIAS